MVYGDFKDLPGRIATDNALYDKAFKIVINLKHDGYQWSLSSMFYNTSGDAGGAVKNKISNNLKNYTNQLLKIKKEKKRSSSFVYNIWGPNLAAM